MDSIGKLVAKVGVSVSQRMAAGLPAPDQDEQPTDVKPTLVDKTCDYDLPSRLFMPWIPDNAPREIKRELTTGERGQLTLRRAVLADGLRPFLANERDRAGAAVAAMLGGFRSLRQQGEDVEATVDVLLAVLRDFPLWAIERGCLAIARRDTDPPLDPRFPPNDAQIFDIVERMVAPYRKILATVEAVLNAPVALPPPSKPQATCAVDAISARCSSEPKYRVPEGDGKHAERVKAELDARKARRAAEQEQESAA